MSSVSIFDNPSGRTAIFSMLLALVVLFFAFTIPLVDKTSDVWYGFLYKDLDIPEKDRYNLALVFLETILLTLFYLFMVIFLGSLAELRNSLPSWGEVFTSGAVTALLAFLLPRISVGGGLGGTEGSTGFNHFTTDMQLSVFLGTLLGIILMTLYLIYSADDDN